MNSMKSATVLSIAIVFLNLHQYDTATINKDSDKATTTDATMSTTNSSAVNKFMDMDGIFNNLFPNFNNGGNGRPGFFQNNPNNGYQGYNPSYPGNHFNNFNGGNYPVNPKIPQGNNQLYPGNNFNNFNGGNYPVNPNTPQGNNQQYPGNNFNNLNGGNYPVNPNSPQGNNQQYPGNLFNDFNGGNYPVNPNTPQDNNPQYPGNDFNEGNHPVNTDNPEVYIPEYPDSDIDDVNGGIYPGNTNIPQENPQYPGAGSNLDNGNNWNNNGYPGNYQNRPSYPNEQDPSIIIFPEDRPTQAVPQGQSPGFNQGQPQDPRETLHNGNPGLQNGVPFNPQDSNRLNNLPNGHLEKPSLQYPQTNRPEINTSTTKKVAILGLPVTVNNENTQKPFITTSTSSAMKQCVQDCPATSEYNPVCGSNNVTYFNEGKIECARYCGIDVTAKRNGACTGGVTPGVFG